MRKIVFTLCACTLSSFLNAQTNKAKDTIKTEVINVITSYTPTISDAFKIRKNPKIKLGVNSQRKQLKYQIFSAPVASTFTPKTGIAKSLNIGARDQIFKNYIAAGFGNNSTPFLEAFLNHSIKPKNNIGVYTKYISSENSIDATLLNSNYSQMYFGAFYKQEEQDYTWKVNTNYQQNTYNWYGLPSTITYLPTTIATIEEAQTYTNFNTNAEIILEDSFLKSTQIKLSLFSDAFSSKELRFVAKPKFKISLKNIGKNFNELVLNTSLDYLNGHSQQSYSAPTKLEHSFFTLGVFPKYNFEHKKFNFSVGTKIYFTSDIENKAHQFYAYPDININYPIVENHMYLYVGASGDLNTNTIQNLTELNPYISPTQFITQTNQKYDFFSGLHGKLLSNISYNLKVSYSDEDDKALFVQNNSKTDGITSAGLLGYEYGNSFSVIYDDVQTLSFSGKISMDIDKNLVVGAYGEFNSFTLANQTEAWNLPSINTEIFANYKTSKWYAGATIFAVSQRKDVTFNTTYPSSINGTQTLKSFLDLNINGGYHINNQFTVFLKINNITNSKYQQFSNFNVQGLQVLGGVSYQFDF